MNKSTNFLSIGAWMMALAVVLGAFGAHALKAQLEAAQLETYQIGVRYHFYHALGLLLIGILQKNQNRKGLKSAGWIMLAGILLFSGSLYGLACRSIIGLELSFLGPITPIGGLCFIAAWCMLGWVYRKG